MRLLGVIQPLWGWGCRFRSIYPWKEALSLWWKQKWVISHCYAGWKMEFSEFTLCVWAIHWPSGTHDLCLIYPLGNVLQMGLHLDFSKGWGNKQPPFYLSVCQHQCESQPAISNSWLAERNLINYGPLLGESPSRDPESKNGGLSPLQDATKQGRRLMWRRESGACFLGLPTPLCFLQEGLMPVVPCWALALPMDSLEMAMGGAFASGDRSQETEL